MEPSTESSIILQKASKKKAAEVKQKVSKGASTESSMKTPKKGIISWIFG
jgi:hypothetical protein